MIGQPPLRALRAHPPAPGDRVLGAFWYLVVAAALAGLLWSLWILVIPIALGYLASILLAPAVDSLYRRGLTRSGAALSVTGVLLVVIALAVWQTAPLVLRQYEAFHANLPVYQQQINAQLEGLFQLLGHLVPSTELIHTRDALYAKLKSGGSPFRSLEELFAVLPLVENVLLALVVSFFLLATGMEMRQAVVTMVPNRYFEMVLRLMYRIQQQTSNYIRGQSMDCAINAVLISLTLWVLGIPYSGLIGLVAGLANAIPFVGPIAGGIPAVLICLLDPQSLTPLWHTLGLTFVPAPSWWFVALSLFGIHMIDANFIYPYTVGRSLRINALVVILAIALGAHVGGIVGMLVIIPILGLLRGIIGELHTSLRGFNII